MLVGHPVISPDGGRIAAVVNEDGNNGDIFVFDLARGTRQRLTFDSAWEILPCWSPDGKLIYYVSTSDATIRVRAADGTGAETIVRKGWAPDLSRDGRWMVYDSSSPSTPGGMDDISVVPMPADSTVESRVLLGSKASERFPQISPSVEYLAYESDESGRGEIYLTRFPGGEGKWQVSVNGGKMARWDPDGGRLYFVTSDAVMAVDITEKPELHLGNPVELFKLADANVVIGRTSSVAVGRGGKHFAMSYSSLPEKQMPKLRLVLVENWLSEFTKKEKSR